MGTPDGTDAPDSRLESWPGENRRHPPASSATWLVRSNLTAWLRSEAAAAGAAAEGGGLRVLDVGCGLKPYYPLFARYADSYVGSTSSRIRWRILLGSVEALPVSKTAASTSCSVRRCSSTATDPVQAVKELRRVTAPGGRVLASTHGVQVFHPSPHDYWRWTHEGLRRLFAQNASWGELGVKRRVARRPAWGCSSAPSWRSGAGGHTSRRLARGPVWMLNRGGSALDGRVSVLRQPVPGALFANLHVNRARATVAGVASLAPRWWWWALGGCVAVRLAIPLAALVAEGTALPGLPAYHYGPLYGDANGYYAAAREVVASAPHAVVPLAATILFGSIALVIAVRRKASPALILLVAGAVIAIATTVVIARMHPSGAPVVGWPLLWAIGLAPLRVLDPGFGPDKAFVVGVALSLGAVAATVVATAYVGLWSSGKRRVGAVAAALFAVWPFVPGLVVGSRGWENGTWNVDVGLHLYTEPFSTALVVGAIALLLWPRRGDVAAVLAGLALGYATVVKLSDGLIAAGLIAILLVSRQWRPAVLVSAGGLVSLPVVVVYWNKGYIATYGGKISASDHPWSLHYISSSWSDSLLFTPLLIALLVVPTIVGAIVLPTMLARAMTCVPIVLTVLTYSVYVFTAEHPRFYYVVLPLVIVLDAAAIVAAADAVLARRRSSDAIRAA